MEEGGNAVGNEARRVSGFSRVCADRGGKGLRGEGRRSMGCPEQNGERANENSKWLQQEVGVRV